MATVTLTIPDAAMPRITEAFASTYGWNAQMGVTKAAFAKDQVIQFVKRTVVEAETRAAKQAAAASLGTELASVNIT